MRSMTDRHTAGPELTVATAMITPADRVARLAMDARHDLERRDLYRAKRGGPHAASPERMRQLERAYERSAERFESAEAEWTATAATRAMAAGAAASAARRHLALLPTP
jgi:hypothetical protein